MTVKEQYNKTLADTLIQNLKKRQIEGFYCATIEEAKVKALSFVAEGAAVAFEGSMTLAESGILDALRAKSDIHLIDRNNAKTSEETRQMYRDAFSADTYFMSTNAITLDGELINIDGNGNRVAALIYGPDQVIIVAGLNKVTANVEDGIRRVRNCATPPNCIRLNKKTPCAATGRCADCLSPEGICNQIVITRRSGNPDRIKVILIGESLGY